MMFRAITRVMQDDSGFAAIDYGLIAAIVAVVIVPAMSMAGCSFDRILNAVSAVLSSTAG